MKKALNLGVALLVSLGLAGTVYANSAEYTEGTCEAAGPQAPRDIDNGYGINPTHFELAPAVEAMNLCNIHYHWNAEHKGGEFTTYVEAVNDEHSGWASALDRVEDLGSEIGVVPGDTVEIHWVYTTCDVESSSDFDGIHVGLGECTTTTCANPQLQVIAQVFLVKEHGKVVELAEPMKHHDPTVTYTGSTTGPTYSEENCSPCQVTWNVKTTCDTLEFDALEEWSHEDADHHEHAHGVRTLVTNPALLSQFDTYDNRRQERDRD